MSYELELRKIMNQDVKDRIDYEKRLKEICNKSNRITYEGLIKKILDVTEYRIDMESYKFTSFIGWLVDDLENFFEINNKDWDKTALEIEQENSNDLYWIEEFKKAKNEKCFQDHTWKDFKYTILDFTFTYSLDSAFYNLQKEYLYRKEKGLI